MLLVHIIYKKQTWCFIYLLKVAHTSQFYNILYKLSECPPDNHINNTAPIQLKGYNVIYWFPISSDISINHTTVKCNQKLFQKHRYMCVYPIKILEMFPFFFSGKGITKHILHIILELYIYKTTEHFQRGRLAFIHIMYCLSHKFK